MPRIRTIKPEFWEDEKLSSLPLGCRLFFIGTWNFADDQGVFRANEKILKSKIFPYDDNLRVTEIHKWLEDLEKARMIIPISHAGESYYVIRTFTEHQIIDKRYCKYIVPQQVVNNTLLSHSEHTVNTMEEKERKGKEKEGDISPHPDFLKFLDWVKVNAPNVLKMESPFTEIEFFKAKQDFGIDVIIKYLKRMHNWKDLKKKNVSANLTMRNWINKDNKGGTNPQSSREVVI